MTDWYSWLYHYGVGGLFFSICLALMLKSRAIRLEDRHHRRLVWSMIGGLLLFMVVHAAWILVVTA